MDEERGVYVVCALFCSAHTEGEGGTITLHQVHHHRAFAPEPGGREVFRFGVEAYISLASAGFAGTRHVELIPPPSVSMPALSHMMHFSGEGSRAAMGLYAEMEFRGLGVHWFEVRCDGVLLTRMPYLISHRDGHAGGA